LHDQLETFYEGTVMTEGRYTTLADHFQTLDWLLNEIYITKQKFEELYQDSQRKKRRNTKDTEDYAWLAAAAEVSWRKAEEYFDKVDDTAAYYVAISLNPTLKNKWFEKVWLDHEEKKPWISTASKAVKELWLDEYKGKYSTKRCTSDSILKPVPPRKEKLYTSVRDYKRLKTNHQPSEPETPTIDHFDQYIETDIIPLADDETFDPIQYWQERYNTQPDLARMALDALAVPAMSDECERLFSSAKLLLNDRRSRLKMDIIESSECLRAWYGPAKHRTFDDNEIGLMEGELPVQKDGEFEDTSSHTEEDSTKEEPLIDQRGEGETVGEAGGKEDTGAGADAIDEDVELYYVD